MDSLARRVDIFQWPALFGLIVLTSTLTSAFDSTFVVERPAHTAVAFLSSAGLTLLLSTFLKLPQHHKIDRDQQSHNALPLQLSERRPYFRAIESAFDFVGARPLYHSSSRLYLLVLTAALVFRVQTSRFQIHHVECTTGSLEPLLPAVVVIIDVLLRQWQHWSSFSLTKESHNGLLEKEERSFAAFSWVQAVTVILISILSTVASHAFEQSRSTYICASSTPFGWMVPLSQHLTVLVDAIIVVCVSRIVQTTWSEDAEQIGLPVRIRGVAVSLLATATLITTAGLLSSTIHLAVWRDIIHLPGIYFVSLIKMSVLTATCVLCAVYAFQHFGLWMTTVGIVFVAVSTTTTSQALSIDPNLPIPAPPPSPLGRPIAILMVLSTLFYLHINHIQTAQHEHSSRRVRTTRVYLVLYLATVIVLAMHSHVKASPQGLPDHFHTRMYDAYVTHQSFSRTASVSEDLKSAVQVYRRRYHRYPPPRFDVWYQYATARRAAVVDRFDGLWQDLQPFYALDPKEIRTRTQDLINDPNNDIAGVTIRDGRAHAGPNVPAKHEWAIEAIVKMLNQFAEHLPDMDLAFNTNDANRVVVPYERIEYLRQMSEAPTKDSVPQNEWQAGRSSLWPRLTGDVPNSNIMHQLGALDNVYDHVATGCPPNSPARRRNFWKVGSSCTECEMSTEKKDDKFETQRADICKQPDLQHLHGAYSAPGLVKLTNKLYPVFSQSRAPGFHDILYPSAWDYVDRTAYAPDVAHQDPFWEDKTNDVYWRGSTTEGVSDGRGAAKWQGMLRQRFVHLANNIKGASPPALLYRWDALQTGHTQWFMPVAGSDITKLVPTDIQITPDIARCEGVDCDVQRWEFAPTSNQTDFQDLWQHRYLLDMDGPTASTRFLPMLRSRSVPLRASILQEWWHDRVTPWVHYVPLSVRGTDFWTILAWFRGVDGNVNGQPLKLLPLQDKAELIATAGKTWAEAALRKEDMEIYFFRLLLEWARITDDNRDDIGYS